MIQCENRIPIFLKHIIALVLTITAVAMIVVGMHYYEICFPSILNMITYFVLFLGTPILILVIYRKKRLIRGYSLTALALLVPLSVWFYYVGIETVETDFSSYINGKTVFFETAKDYLLTDDEILDAEKIEYLHNRRNVGSEYLWITLQYNVEEFEHIDEKLNRIYETHLTENNACYKDNDFIFCGQVYHCLITLNEEHYAMAYSSCKDSCIINLVFLCDSNLTSISVGDVWSSYHD